MTPLTQQLEDKKKELQDIHKDLFKFRKFPNIKHNYNPKTKQKLINKLKVRQAEIAILEQAIAEMQKQRQEIIEELRYNLKMEIQGYPFPIYNQIPIDMFIDEECDKVKQQLNQPKTEE